MTPLNNNSISPRRPILDRTNIIILGVFLALSIGLGVFAFLQSQNFFATTSIIKVGDAPPIYTGGQPADPKSTPGLPGVTPSPDVPSLPNIEPAASVPAKPWDGTSRVTILVMGLDYRDWLEGSDVPRTDTMILVSIDPLSKSIGMISIPRDMWVSIPGFTYSRINTAYRNGELYKLPGGGPALAMKTVELFLGVPVDYYALIDFNAFVKFIDELGGLDMHIKEDIKVDPIGPGNTIVLKPGVQTLNGATALAYARMRYTKDGDFDRSTRQQEVIMALRDQIVDLNQVPMLLSKAPKLYQELSSGIRTNLSLDQAIQLGLLATQVKREDIHRAVFDPHKDVQYGSVTTGDGPADILVPNPDQIRILRNEVFVDAGQIGPNASVTDPAERVKAENARIAFKNGNSNPAMAQQAGDLMRSLGLQIISEEGASTVTANTTFIDHTGKPYTINYLIEKLNVPQSRVKIDFNPNAGSDLEVILGEDFQGAP